MAGRQTRRAEQYHKPVNTNATTTLWHCKDNVTPAGLEPAIPSRQTRPAEQYRKPINTNATSKLLHCKDNVTPAGLEPAIPGSVGRCLIHWATGPVNHIFATALWALTTNRCSRQICLVRHDHAVQQSMLNLPADTATSKAAILIELQF